MEKKKGFFLRKEGFFMLQKASPYGENGKISTFDQKPY